MKVNRIQAVAATLACIGMVMPTAAFAVPAVPNANKTVDVALQHDGVLVGQVVDQQGNPLAGAAVSVNYQGREIVRTTTDQNGVFAARQIRGGQYFIVTDRGQASFRLWAPNTAPPAAQKSAVVVAGGDVVRGQYPYGTPLLDWMRTHPYLTAGFVAAAIAIPIAVAADDDDPSS